MDGPLILSRDEREPWIFLSPFHKDQNRKEWGPEQEGVGKHVLPTLPQASCWLWGVEPEASKGSSQRGLSVPLGQLGESRDTIEDGTEAAGALSVCLVPLRRSEDTGGVVH